VDHHVDFNVKDQLWIKYSAFCKYVHAWRKQEHTKTGQCWITFSPDVFLFSIKTHTLK